MELADFWHKCSQEERRKEEEVAVKSQSTGGTKGNGPKWRGQTSGSYGPQYERTTAVTRRKAAIAKKSATAPKRGSRSK